MNRACFYKDTNSYENNHMRAASDLINSNYVRMKRFFLPILLLNILLSCAQHNDSVFISNISNEALKNKAILLNLKYLCDSAPGRLVGSKESLKALHFLKSKLVALKPDTCFFQEYETPAWVHHATHAGMIIDGKEKAIHALALGPSVRTDAKGIQTEVIEVGNFDDLKKAGRKNIEGKIVFFNRIMSNQYINPSDAYRDVIKYRFLGAIEASKYGASAAIIRSLTTVTDTFPHTGKTTYNDSVPKIPFVAISTQDADFLSDQLKKNPALKFNLFVNAEPVEKVKTYNLIADFKGSEKPDEFILIGAHVDSWYNTKGAHDDGAGCVQVIEIVRIFRELGYKTKRSIRIVLFMDEELFQSGAASYANYTEKNNIKHYVAIETDAGGFAPKSFSVDASDAVVTKLIGFTDLLKPYGLYSINKGSTDVDIEMLKPFDVPLIGNKPQNQRYFDYHHCSNDTFDKVNFREMQLSTITLAGLIYLIDKYGIK